MLLRWMVALGLMSTLGLALPGRAQSAVVYTEGATVKVTGPDGAVVFEIAPAIWGPGWKFASLGGDFEPAGQGAQATFEREMPGTGVPMQLAARLSPEGDRRLRMEVTYRVARDTDLTQAVMSIKPGSPVRGDDRATIVDASGSTTRAIPFGRGALSESIRRIVMRDDAGQQYTITFEEPTAIGADNDARIQLASDHLAAGDVRRLSMAIELPVAATFALSPANAPMPDNWDDWFPWKATSATDQPSVIDVSGWLEKPAGEHGRIERRGDQLLYDGQPIKIWGTNLTYVACAPDHGTAERQAAFYAKYGINGVRLHKYADGPGWQGILTDTSFVRFVPEKLDNMDYFVAQLKQRGIYTNLSAVFGSARLGPADLDRVPFADELGEPGRNGWITVAQGATFFAPELQDLHIEQVVRLLDHRNPYTGLRYADDPAVAFVELINENSIYFFALRAMQNYPTIKQRAGEAFFAWARQKYGTKQALYDAWGESTINSFGHENMTGEGWDQGVLYPVGNPWFFNPEQLEGAMRGRKQRLLDTITFFYEHQNRFYDRFVEAIRNTGYAGEITSSNWQAGRAFSHYANLHSDARIGLIDRHNYFGGAGSMLANPGGGMLSAGMQQVADRPFMLSEWIHVFPNEYGMEGPAILGAYGMGLNGWDASFIFQNRDQGRFRDELKDRWDVVAPQVLGVFPAVARQIYRGDVRESDLTFVRKVHVPSLAEGRLGFEDRVSQEYDVKEFGSDVAPAASLTVGRGVVEFTDRFESTPRVDMSPYTRGDRVRSATGQLAWKPGDSQRDGYFTIDTPGTQALVGFAEDVTAELADVTLQSHSPYGAIYVSAVSPDGTIAGDDHLLVTTIARVRNTGMKVIAGEMVERGGPPMLVEPVRVDLTLRRPGRAVVHVLDHDGQRTGRTLPVQNGRVTLDGAKTRAVYYEIEYR